MNKDAAKLLEFTEALIGESERLKPDKQKKSFYVRKIVDFAAKLAYDKTNLVITEWFTSSDAAEFVANYVSKYNISFSQITSKSHLRDYVTIRNCLYVFLRKKNMTLSEIGEVFNRDHTTVINGIKKVKIWGHFDDYKNHIKNLEI